MANLLSPQQPEPTRLQNAVTVLNDVIYRRAERFYGARWCSWVKSFAAYKRNVSVAYAWEPVLIKEARKPVVSKRHISRDWIMCPITLKRGLTGAKPEAVCHWAFELLGARPEDDLSDLFPGTGAVTKAWATWQGKFTLPEQESKLELVAEA